MKIKVRRETARCTNCGKINEFYYLSDFLYGERLVIFHNGMSYAYINLLEDDVYNDFIKKVDETGLDKDKILLEMIKEWIE